MCALGLLAACRPAAVDTAAPCPAEVCPEVADPRFRVVVLGAQGGVVTDDLSAYLVAPHASDAFVCLDAGSVFTGLERAAALGSLGPGVRAEAALRERIRGYLISHPHLDHVAGLAIAAPDDVAGKFIGGDETTLAAIASHLFNGTLWANFFAGRGPEPRVGFYAPLPLRPGLAAPLPGTEMSAELWPLNHPGGASAFLLTTAAGDALLYLGDTAADAVAGGDNLARLWDRVAPLIRAGKLRAIFIEVSYPDPRPRDRLFGHLTPSWLHAELTRLAAAVDPQGRPLRGLVVAVTHIKPAPDVGRQIREQLAALPDLGVRFVFPAQGRLLAL